MTIFPFYINSYKLHAVYSFSYPEAHLLLLRYVFPSIFSDIFYVLLIYSFIWLSNTILRKYKLLPNSKIESIYYNFWAIVFCAFIVFILLNVSLSWTLSDFFIKTFPYFDVQTIFDTLEPPFTYFD